MLQTWYYTTEVLPRALLHAVQLTLYLLILTTVHYKLRGLHRNKKQLFSSQNSSTSVYICVVLQINPFHLNGVEQ